MNKKIISILAFASIFMLNGCSNNHKQINSSKIESTNLISNINTSTNSINNNLNKLINTDYQSGTNPVIIINNNHSTLNKDDWKINKVEYQNLDDLNRTSQPVTAYLEKRNLANDSLRVNQVWKPTGWQQKFDQHHNAILNRGHIIAYSISKGIAKNGLYDPTEQSGDQNNPKNLFTQTAFSNQKLQTIYEQKVRDALKDNEKVIYQVQPLFRGNEKMARGIHLQAISTNGKLDFNVFIYNVQPNYKFDYSTGKSVIDNQMNVPLPDNENNTSSKENANQYYNNHIHGNNDNYNTENHKHHYYHKHYYRHHNGFNN